MIREANSDIEIIHSYYKDLLNDFNPKKHTPLHRDELGNPLNISYKLYQYMQDAVSDVRFASVVSDEEFDRSEGDMVYHGFQNLDFAANFLCDFSRHYGFGIRGGGFYVTTGFDDANRYTEKEYTYFPQNIVKFKMETNNAVSFHTLRIISRYLNDNMEPDMKMPVLDKKRIDRIEQLKEYLDEYGEDDEFKENFTSNDSILALYLGYDIVKTIGSHNVDHYVVLNLEKLKIAESEFNRVMTAAKREQSANIEK